MTIALYMDVHVHRAITTGLRLRDVDVLTAQEDGHLTAGDERLLDRATELQLGGAWGKRPFPPRRSRGIHTSPPTAITRSFPHPPLPLSPAPLLPCLPPSPICSIRQSAVASSIR